MKAITRSLRITSKKLNLVADLVRMKDAKMALNILKFTPKKGAQLLQKVIRSAMANAQTNFKQEPETLFVKEIIITEGASLRRGVPVSRGRIHPIKKRTSHATVILGVKEDEKMTTKTSTTHNAKAEVKMEEKNESKKQPKAVKTGKAKSATKTSTKAKK